MPAGPTPDQIDAYLVNTLAIIDKHGVMIQAVMSEVETNTPGFAYTVGLSRHHHPELIIDALAPNVAHYVLNTLAREVIDNGRQIMPGEEIAGLVGGPFIAKVTQVTDMSDFSIARRLYPVVTGLQLILPDTQGNYPWEPGWIYPFTIPMRGPRP